MAKQNVTYVERHVEKLVIGLAAALLLGVVVTYLLTNPHQASAGGQARGPSAFYQELARQAAMAHERLKNASYSPPENPLAGLAVQPGDQPPPGKLNTVCFAPIPPLPEVKAGDTMSFQQQVELVEILPPTKPQLTTGRSSGRYPEPLTIPLGPGQPIVASTETTPLTSDKQWVTIAATISREAQMNAFVQAGYLPGRLEMIVVDVLVERQERLPNGQWSQPQRVAPYAPIRFVPDRTVIEVVADGAGYSISPADNECLTNLRATFEKTEQQDRVLRPPFQEFIMEATGPGSDPFAWKVPASLAKPDGTMMDLRALANELGIVFERSEESTSPTGPGGRQKPPRGQGAPSSESTPKNVREALRMAQQAIEKNEFPEAERLLQRIIDDPDANTLANRAITTQAQKLLAEHERDFELARQRLEESETAGRPGLQQNVSKIGPDVEPLWANDTSATPGKCYRYRLALLVINPYAGAATYLKKPEDARKLLLEGQWSEWSEPLIVPPDKYLFVTEVKPSSGTAQLEMQQWVAGNWKKTTVTCSPGDVVEIAQSRPGSGPGYSAVVLAVDGNRRALQPDRRAKNYQPTETGAVLLVDAQGEIDEHLVAIDTQTRAAFRSMLTEQAKQQAKRAKERENLGPQERPRRGPARPSGPPGRSRPPAAERESRGS